MSQEISLTASLTGYKPTSMAAAVSRALTNFLANMTGGLYTEGTIIVPTGGIALPIGTITTPYGPHWCYLRNNDATNYVTLRNGSMGADVLQLYPGEPAFVPLLITGSFFLVANTALCLVEFLVFSN